MMYFALMLDQIVELDPVVGDVAKLHFGFIEDDRMKVVSQLSCCYLFFSSPLR